MVYTAAYWSYVVVIVLVVLYITRLLLGRLSGSLIGYVVRSKMGLARDVTVTIDNIVMLPNIRAKGIRVKSSLGFGHVHIHRVSVETHLASWLFCGGSAIISVYIAGISGTMILKSSQPIVDIGDDVVQSPRRRSGSIAGLRTSQEDMVAPSLPRWIGFLLLSTRVTVTDIVVKLYCREISHALVFSQPTLSIASSRSVEDPLAGNVQFLTSLSIPRASMSWKFHDDDPEEILVFSKLNLRLYLQQRDKRVVLSLGSALEIELGALRAYGDFAGLSRIIRLMEALPQSRRSSSFDERLLLFVQKAQLRIQSLLGRLDMQYHCYEVTADVDSEAVVALEGPQEAIVATVDLSMSVVADVWPHGAARFEAQPLSRLSGIHAVFQVTLEPRAQALALDVKATTTAMVFHVRPEHILAHLWFMSRMSQTVSSARGMRRSSHPQGSPSSRSRAKFNFAASLNSVVAHIHSVRSEPASVSLRFDTPSATAFGVLGGLVTCIVQSTFVGASAHDFRGLHLALPLADEALAAHSFSLKLRRGPRGSSLDVDASINDIAFQVSPELVASLIPLALHAKAALAEFSLDGPMADSGGGVEQQPADSTLVCFTFSVAGLAEVHIIDRRSNGGTEPVFLSLKCEDLGVSREQQFKGHCSMIQVARVRVRPDRQKQFPPFFTLDKISLDSVYSLSLCSISLRWSVEAHLQVLETMARFLVVCLPLKSAAEPPKRRRKAQEEEELSAPATPRPDMRVSVAALAVVAQFSRVAVVRLSASQVSACLGMCPRAELLQLEAQVSPNRHRILSVPRLCVTAEAREGAAVALQLAIYDALWSLVPGFDFGFMMDQLLTVAKAVAGESAAILSPLSSQSEGADEAPPPKIILEAQVHDSCFELREDEFQRRLRAAFGVFTDEVAERALRFELMERQLREMSRAGSLSDALAFEIRQRFKRSDAELYCRRVKQAIENAPTSQFTITAADVQVMVAFDLSEKDQVLRLRQLNENSSFFPSSFSYKFDTIVGMALDVRTSELRLQYRDLPFPWVFATGVHAHGHVVFAEENPLPESIVHWTVKPSATREIYTQRTAMNLKIYHDLEATADNIEYAMGVSYDWPAKEFQMAFALMVPENLDNHQMCWWDKMRFMFHGRLAIRTKKFTWRVMATLNPYDKDAHLCLLGSEVSWAYRTNEMSLNADKFGFKINTQSEAFFQTKNFGLIAGMRWICAGDEDDHLLFPTPSFEGPFIVDASDETSSPSYLDNPLDNFDVFEAFRAKGLGWDLELSFDPVDDASNSPVISLDSPTISWFNKFGSTMSFPEVYLRPSMYRPSHPGFFSPIFRDFRLHIKCRQLSVVYFETRDVHDPSGIKVSVEYLDLSTGFRKGDKGWKPTHGPFHARGLQAVIYPPEDYARFYDTSDDPDAHFEGTLLMSAPALSLVQDENEMGTIQHFTIHGLRLAISPPVARLLARWKNNYSQHNLRAAAQKRDAPVPERQEKAPSHLSRKSFRVRKSKGHEATPEIQFVDTARHFMSRYSGKTRYLVEVVDAQVKLITLDPEGAVALVADSIELSYGTNASDQALILVYWREYEMYCSPEVDVWQERDSDSMTRILTKGSMQFQIISSGEKLVEDGLAEAKGMMNLVSPSVMCHMNAHQFRITTSVFSKFLLEQNSSSEHHEELLATVMFKLQLNPESVGDVNILRNNVKRLNSEIKDMRSKVKDLEMEVGVSPERLNASHHQLWQKQREYQASLEVLSLLTEAQSRLRKKEKELVLPTWKLNVLVNQVHWHLLETGRNTLFCEVMLRNIKSSTVIREDESGLMRLEVNRCSIMNHMPNALGQYLHTLAPLRSRAWSDRDTMLRMLASKRQPVGGITLYDHFELNISPLRVNITDNIYAAVFRYVFPEESREEHLDSLQSSKNEMLITRPMKESAGLNRTFCDFRIAPTGEVSYSYEPTHYQLMRARSEIYKMFIYIKITDVPVIVTFHKAVTFKNLKISLHALEYRVKAWSWEDITSQVKKEVILDLISQAGRVIKHTLTFRRRQVSEADLEDDVTVRPKSKLDLKLSELSRNSRAALLKVSRGRVGKGGPRREGAVELKGNSVQARLERTVLEEELEVAKDFEDELESLKRELLFGQTAVTPSSSAPSVRASLTSRRRTRTRPPAVVFNHSQSVASLLQRPRMDDDFEVELEPELAIEVEGDFEADKLLNTTI